MRGGKGYKFADFQRRIVVLARFSEGGTGFQPVTCGSHSQDGCAILRTPQETSLSVPTTPPEGLTASSPGSAEWNEAHPGSEWSND
jgi:hypothetical protein